MNELVEFYSNRLDHPDPTQIYVFGLGWVGLVGFAGLPGPVNTPSDIYNEFNLNALIL